MKIMSMPVLASLTLALSTGCLETGEDGDEPELFETDGGEEALGAETLKSCTYSKYEDPYHALGLMQASASVNYKKITAGWAVTDLSWTLTNGRQTESDENKITLRFQYNEGNGWKDAATESFIRTKMKEGNGSAKVNAGLLSNGRVRVKIHFSFDSYIAAYSTGACYIELK